MLISFLFRYREFGVYDSMAEFCDACSKYDMSAHLPMVSVHAATQLSTNEVRVSPVDFDEPVAGPSGMQSASGIVDTLNSDSDDEPTMDRVFSYQVKW